MGIQSAETVVTVIPSVLIVSHRDLSSELGQTVLWRDNLRRITQPDPHKALGDAGALQPRLIIIDRDDIEEVAILARSFRRQGRTRSAAIAALTSTPPSPRDEESLLDAGVNVVLRLPVDPYLWDARLEQLLHVSSRRQIRIPVRIDAWSSFGSEDEALQALALNISVGGMLLQPERRLRKGPKLDVFFRLPPDPDEISAVSRVVWQRGPNGERLQSGIEFLVFRNDGRARVGRFVELASQSPQTNAEDTALFEESREWEAQLRATEARKASILDSVADAIFTIDHEGRVLEYNKAAEQLLALRPGEGSSTLLEKWIKGQPLALDLKERLKESFGDRRIRLSEIPILTMATRGDGTQIAVELTTSPVYIEGRPLLTVCLRDITQQRQAEEERAKLAERVAQTQKLESLGLLASGIAHDFNNLLAVILSGAELAILEMPDDSPVRRRVEEVKNAALHASDLTQQMLAYAGQGHSVVEPLDLSRVVEDLTHLLRSSLSRKAVLETRFDPDIPRVEGDRAQLRQVILNLITNASDAIGSDGGTIVVKTGETHLNRQSLRGLIPAEGLTPGRYSYLEVADTGCGMDAETQTRIFDPFYSTKSQGRGLGLSSALGIVRSHRGALKVTSRPGHGTSVRLLLPGLDSPVEPKETLGGEEHSWRGSGTALVIEDERRVRRITAEMMQRLGFEVLTAPSGKEGVRLVQDHPGAIAVVLLDFTAAEVSGDETYREIERLRPDTPVILTSGYSREEARKLFADSGLSGFLQKPYRLRTLVETLKAVLKE